MRSLLSSLLVSLGLVIAHGRGAGPGDEPSLEMVLELDGQRHSAVEGAPFTIELGGRKVEAKMTLSPTRRFHAGGVTFRYPREMQFEYDDSDDIPMWTLDGNDCVLLVTVLDTDDPDQGLREQLELTASALGVEDPEFTPWSLTTRGMERTGLQGRFYFEPIEADVSLHGFAVRHGGHTITIVLEDFPDDGEHEEEGARIFALLSESFVVEGD